MMVWHNGKFVDMKIGQEVTVFRCGGFSHAVFGESAHLDRVTKQHLVFVTESGSVVKTDRENIFKVAGKMGKAGWCVSLRKKDTFAEIIAESASYWDEKTGKFKSK